MISGKRIAWGVGVLGLGFCAALPFQKRSDSPVEKAPLEAIHDLVLQPADVTLEASLPFSSSPAADWVGPGARGQQKPVVQRQATVQGLEGVTPQPRMSVVYPGWRGDWDSPPPREANGPGPMGAEAPAPDAAPRRHRIADGDTLRDLARKYLGRSDRHLEIYEANRDVLTRPDLLPVGAEIRIPPLRPVTPAPPSPAIPRSKLLAPTRDGTLDPRNHLDPPAVAPLAPIPSGALEQSVRRGGPAPPGGGD